MRNHVHFVIIATITLLITTSCQGPKLLVKQGAKIDTLHLQLDLRIVQEYEYQQAILKKMTRFVEVYNSEIHPFKLSLNSGVQTTSCQIEVVRVKFVRSKQNLVGTAVSVAGIGTAAYLIASGFAVPFGWVYIPSARTTITPQLSNDITDVTNFQKVGISSVGMYVKLDKQIDKQSTKFVKYMVSVVQTIEQEYNSNLKK